MAGALRSSSSAVLGSAGTTITINVPSGVQDGDFLLLHVQASGSTAWGALAGWTVLWQGPTGGFPNRSVWYRVASSEPASYAPTWTTSGFAEAIMHAYTGIDTADPFWGFNFKNVVDAAENGTTFTTWGVPSLPTDGVSVMFTCYDDPAVNATLPGGWTAAENPTSGAAPNGRSYGAYQVITDAVCPAGVWTLSGTGPFVVQDHIFLRAAGEADTLAMRYMHSAGSSASPSTLTVTNPTGELAVQDGDLLVAIISNLNTPPARFVPPSAAWRELIWPNHMGAAMTGGTAGSFSVFTKIASSEPASYLWSTIGGGSITSIMVTTFIFRGYRPESPVNVFVPLRDIGSDSVIDFPALDTPLQPALVFAGAFTLSPTNVVAAGTAPTGYHRSSYTRSSSGSAHLSWTAFKNMNAGAPPGGTWALTAAVSGAGFAFAVIPDGGVGYPGAGVRLARRSPHLPPGVM